MSGIEVQLQAKEEELQNLKISFDEYVKFSKELETELEADLEDTQKLNKTLSIQKATAEQHIHDITHKLNESRQTISRIQDTLNSRDDTISLLVASKRDLEQRVEAGEETLRQAEFTGKQAVEQRDEKLRADKQSSEERMKEELTELLAEVARLLDDRSERDHQPPHLPSSKPEKNEEEDNDDDRFPVFHMFILAVAVLSSAIALTTLFPYIGFMIMDVGVAANLNEAGYYSGAIASAMMFGRFASSFLWGRLADTYGRKPPLMIGCLCITSMSIMFGMSTSLWMMVLSRVILGLFNPIWGIAKTLVSELCSRKYEARAMGLTASCWSLGVVLGPVIGGFLANPGELYPSVFADQGDRTSFFIRVFLAYPYLLPNVVVGGFSFVACCLVFFFLPETLVTHTSSTQLQGSDGATASPQRGATVSELLNTPGVSFALSAYFVLSFIDLSFSEIIPLWAIASGAAGGLGMQQQRIGFLMTFTGCLQVAYTMVFYPVIVGYLGRVQSFRKGQIFFIPFCLGITLLNHFSTGSFTQFTLLVFMFAIARACCSLGNSSIGLIVNRCVRTEQRASINGLSMGVGSMAKAIGPMVSTYLFAWSINPPGESSPPPRRMFPLDFHAIFLIFSLLSVLCIFMPLVYYETDADMEMARLEQMQHQQKKEPKQQQQQQRPMYVFSARIDVEVEPDADADADASTSLLSGSEKDSYGSISLSSSSKV